jgi:hypothetical protein
MPLYFMDLGLKAKAKKLSKAGAIVKESVKEEAKETPKTAALTFLLLFTMFISLIGAVVRQNWGLMFLILVIAILLLLPRIIQKWSKISIPPRLEVYIIIFLYATLFLGELMKYYDTYWWWDVVIHTSSGLAIGIVGFLILYVLYKTDKIKSKPKTIAMLAFTFALAIGALWEITEFTIDNAFSTSHMQGSLSDTMWDLIVDAIGAFVAAIAGYFYIKSEHGLAGKAMKQIA